MDRGIELSEKLIVCCSKTALTTSTWVRKEVRRAVEKEHQWGIRDGVEAEFLLPIDLDGFLWQQDERGGYECKGDVPNTLRERHALKRDTGLAEDDQIASWVEQFKRVLWAKLGE